MRRLSLLGVLNPGLAYALSIAGLAHVTASVSVLLWAIEPILILALAAIGAPILPSPMNPTVIMRRGCSASACWSVAA